MPWTYHQKTGVLEHDGKKVAQGYAGKQACKNNPECQYDKGKGPLPQGKYRIAGEFTSDAGTGPDSLRLYPDPSNNMHGRSGFLIHGDSIKFPGMASSGCIVVPHAVRLKIHVSSDKVLEVVR